MTSQLLMSHSLAFWEKFSISSVRECSKRLWCVYQSWRKWGYKD